MDAASAHTDLLYARELLATLVLDAQGQLEHPSPYSAAVRGALLAQTILLYARAVIVQSKRRRFDIRKFLSPAQLRMHSQIDRMRDGAIAHFDRSITHGDAKWADERVVLPGDDPFRLIPALRRLVVRDELLSELIDQVEVAIQILNGIREEKHTAAKNALHQLLERDGNQIERLQKHKLDVLAFLGDFPTIVDMLGPGYGSGQLHER